VICGGIPPPGAALNATPDLSKVTPPNSLKSYLAAAERVGKTPVWIFHGADDDIVSVTESRRMTEAMKQIGAEVRHTEYPGVGHPCWYKAYEEPKLFPWLFSSASAMKAQPASLWLRGRYAGRLQKDQERAPQRPHYRQNCGGRWGRFRFRSSPRQRGQSEPRAACPCKKYQPEFQNQF
jgi:hypothetical protein